MAFRPLLERYVPLKLSTNVLFNKVYHTYDNLSIEQNDCLFLSVRLTRLYNFLAIKVKLSTSKLYTKPKLTCIIEFTDLT